MISMLTMFCLLLVLLLFNVAISTASATSTVTKYVAEGMILYDEEALRIYESEGRTEDDLKKDIEFHLTNANDLFKTMNQYGMVIELRIVGDIQKAEVNLLDGQTEHDADAIAALSLFKSWVERQEFARKNIHFDFTLLYTGYHFKKFNGAAWIGTICSDPQSKATSIISLKDMYTSHTTAHEIGHIFGADHDGKANKNVMKPVELWEFEAYRFSKCSVFDMSQHLQAIPSVQCLLETHPGSRLPNITVSAYDGPLLDPGFACRLKLHNNTYSYGYSNNAMSDPNLAKDTRCMKLYCWNEQTLKTAWVTAGTPCDKDKICSFGKCMPDPTGATHDVDPNCMFGDMLQIKYNGKIMTCKEAYESLGGIMCWDLKHRCCATCPRLAAETGVPGCYGDTKTLNVRLSNDVLVQRSCAESLAIDGAEFICSDTVYYAPRCCKSCALLNGASLGCKYKDEAQVKVGNVYVTCEEAYMEVGATLCTSNYPRCCETCAKKQQEVGMQGCYGDAKTLNVRLANRSLIHRTCGESVAIDGANFICQDTDYYAPRCCKSCALLQGALLGCKYKDEKQVKVGNVYGKCEEAHKLVGPTLCTSNYPRCCETCAKKEKEIGVQGCYGDAKTLKVRLANQSLVQRSCIESLAISGANFICQDTNYYASRCCQSCAMLRKASISCMYKDETQVKVGNVYVTCEKAHTLVGPTLCTSDYSRCCETCAKKQQETGVQGCYGDAKRLKIRFPNNVIVHRSCEESLAIDGADFICQDTSYYAPRCCKSCAQLTKASMGCMYKDETQVKVGDVYVTCEEAHTQVGASLCTSNYPRCCETCARKQQEIGVKGCYGDEKTLNVRLRNNVIVQRTCEESIAIEGADFVCQDTDYYAPRCCQSCAKYTTS